MSKDDGLNRCPHRLLVKVAGKGKSVDAAAGGDVAG
jgi:hypothetical protein